jgi:hypothetical protein
MEALVPDDLGRSRYAAELLDPKVRDKLIAYIKAEVGGQGELAKQAIAETFANRGVARNQRLSDVLSGSYFPNITHQRASRPVSEADRAAYQPVIDKVLGGSNITNYATGNASGTVGFAGGPQTYAASGERFGIEGPDRGWWTRIGAAGPGPVGSVGYTSQQPQTLAGLQSQAAPKAASPIVNALSGFGGNQLSDPVGAAILKQYLG